MKFCASPAPRKSGTAVVGFPPGFMRSPLICAKLTAEMKIVLRRKIVRFIAVSEIGARRWLRSARSLAEAEEKALRPSRRAARNNREYCCRLVRQCEYS